MDGSLCCVGYEDYTLINIIIVTITVTYWYKIIIGQFEEEEEGEEETGFLFVGLKMTSLAKSLYWVIFTYHQLLSSFTPDHVLFTWNSNYYLLSHVNDNMLIDRLVFNVMFYVWFYASYHQQLPSLLGTTKLLVKFSIAQRAKMRNICQLVLVSNVHRNIHQLICWNWWFPFYGADHASSAGQAPIGELCAPQLSSS